MSFATYPSLNGAVVFVTGGASGIGEQIVRAFAAQGSKIGFVDIDTERGGALADELGGESSTIRFERHRRPEARFRRARSGDGPRQQCRARRPA